jgi:NAD(P)-dependent dehydrogenase (short-subunit alcohol dehydrogenase family)
MFRILAMMLLFTFFGANCFVNCVEREPNFMIEKKLVVITGVTKGIGLALVEEFTRCGWRVAGCGRSVKTVQELQNKYGSEHLFSVVDIKDNVSVSKWAQEVASKMGIPFILINNAALINHPKVLWEIPSDEFADIMDTNVLGTVNMLRHFIPLMLQKKQGIIVNVSSGWRLNGKITFSSDCEGWGNFSPYCASKFAIEGLTQSLSQELPQGLIAVTLAPGTSNTDMLYKAIPEKIGQYPTAEERAKIIVPYILNIKPCDSGKHLSIEE